MGSSQVTDIWYLQECSQNDVGSPPIPIIFRPGYQGRYLGERLQGTEDVREKTAIGSGKEEILVGKVGGRDGRGRLRNYVAGGQGKGAI